MTVDAKPLIVTDPSNAPVVFANSVVGSGHLNGVVNLTLACARFSPGPDNKIDADLVVAARLRMDLFCAQQLRDALDVILAANLKAANGTTH